MISCQAARTLIAVACTALMVTGCGFNSTGETRTETVSLDLGEAKSARVAIRMGGGQLHVSSGTVKFMEAEFAYNVPEWKPVVDYQAGELTLSQPNYSA